MMSGLRGAVQRTAERVTEDVVGGDEVLACESRSSAARAWALWRTALVCTCPVLG